MVAELVSRMRRWWGRSPAVPASVIWSSVYALLVLTGVGFDTGYLNYGWQLVP